MIYLFGAPPQNQHGRTQLILPGMAYRWVVSAPDKDAARKLSFTHRLGLEEGQRYGIFYQLYPIPSKWEYDPTPRLLCVEKFMGAAQVKQEGVRAGQAEPVGQRGMQRLDGTRRADGFQEHGDEALDPGLDSPYGPPADAGAWSDLIQGQGGAALEMHRE